MTISTITNRVRGAGNGRTTAFAFPYQFEDERDLTVHLTGADGVERRQTLATHYTVSNAGGGSGGTVIFRAAPAAGETVTIVREEPLTQRTGADEVGSFRAQAFERQFDRHARQAQRLQEQLDRAIKMRRSSAHRGFDFPEPQAGRVIGWNDAGDGLENGPPTGKIVQAATAAAEAAASRTQAIASAAGAVASAADAQASAAAAGSSASAAAESARSAAVAEIAWAGTWRPATAYTASRPRQAVQNGGTSYICIRSHVAEAANRPGVGADWATCWQILASRGVNGDGAGDLIAANNLADVASVGQARSNLGLGNVDNTSDADKPVSTAQQTLFDSQQAALEAQRAAVDARAPASRTIGAGTGLSGGGDLSADRTISATIASQTQAEAGTDATTLMTPERTKQAISALAGGSWKPLGRVNASGASQAEFTGLTADYFAYEILFANVYGSTTSTLLITDVQRRDL